MRDIPFSIFLLSLPSLSSLSLPPRRFRLVVSPPPSSLSLAFPCSRRRRAVAYSDFSSWNCKYSIAALGGVNFDDAEGDDDEDRDDREEEDDEEIDIDEIR